MIFQDYLFHFVFFDSIFNELGLLNLLGWTTRNFDALLVQPLVEDCGAGAEQVDLMQAQGTDPLVHVLLAGGRKSHVFSHKSVLVEEHAEAVWTILDLIGWDARDNEIVKRLEVLWNQILVSLELILVEVEQSCIRDNNESRVPSIEE